MYKVDLTLISDGKLTTFYFTDTLIVRTFDTELYKGCAVYTLGNWWSVKETQEEVINKIDNAIQYWVEYNATINRVGR